MDRLSSRFSNLVPISVSDFRLEKNQCDRPLQFTALSFIILPLGRYHLPKNEYAAVLNLLIFSRSRQPLVEVICFRALSSSRIYLSLAASS